jgi:type IV secretory pathway component VirB8
MNKMKNIIIALIIIFIGFQSHAQVDQKSRDSVANTNDFQVKVREATLLAANQTLADTSQHTEYILRYSFSLVNDPQGRWVLAMSYQVLTNPQINYDSPQNDIEFAVNSNFEKMARAASGVVVIPPSHQD